MSINPGRLLGARANNCGKAALKSEVNLPQQALPEIGVILGKYATRSGVVVHRRFNGGVDLVPNLAMFLSGKNFFNCTTDTRSNGYDVNVRWTIPPVAMANEANYCDGHCFAYTYKDQRLGPLSAGVCRAFM